MFSKKQSPNTRSIETLIPAEIWVLIFRHLDVKSILKIAEVCKIFYQLSRDEQIWKEKVAELKIIFPSSTSSMSAFEFFRYSHLRLTGGSEFTLSIVVAGAKGVKKHELVSIFVRDEFALEQKSRIGVDIQSKTMTINGRIVRINANDTTGSEIYRSITQIYYRRADGIFIAFNNNETLDAVEAFLNNVNVAAKEGCKITMLGIYDDSSKQDINEDKIKLLSKKLGIPFETVNLNSPEDVRKVFANLAAEIISSKTKTLALEAGSNTNVNDPSEKKDKKCSMM